MIDALSKDLEEAKPAPELGFLIPGLWAASPPLPLCLYIVLWGSRSSF